MWCLGEREEWNFSSFYEILKWSFVNTTHLVCKMEHNWHISLKYQGEDIGFFCILMFKNRISVSDIRKWSEL